MVGWDEISSMRAHAHDGRQVEIVGWVVENETTESTGYALLSGESPCCCPPRDPGRAIEIFARGALRARPEAVRLRGRWRALRDDPTGWRYQLRDARVVAPPLVRRISRRTLLAAAALFALVGRRRAQAQQLLASTTTVDMHSHAGRITGVRNVEQHGAFAAVADPMRAGGMAAVCFAIVSDSPCHKVMPDGRIHPYRNPNPGELYAYGKLNFERLHELIRRDGLALIADVPTLQAARAGTPSAIVAAEGADFLEGKIDRVDEAYERYKLRHLQLTHYRVNELGDIQTEAPRQGGLTNFGADVIRRCNRLGIVVDVAHGTYDLVKRAASVTAKPLLLSHTSLSTKPSMRSRLISPDHARAIAATGGAIGIWPPASVFANLREMAEGVARMVEVVGIDHVGIGTDLLGLVGPTVFSNYDQLPALAQALLDTGFGADDVAKILGGNYVRVFAASLS